MRMTSDLSIYDASIFRSVLSVKKEKYHFDEYYICKKQYYWFILHITLQTINFVHCQMQHSLRKLSHCLNFNIQK